MSDPRACHGDAEQGVAETRTKSRLRGLIGRRLPTLKDQASHDLALSELLSLLVLTSRSGYSHGRSPRPASQPSRYETIAVDSIDLSPLFKSGRSPAATPEVIKEAVLLLER